MVSLSGRQWRLLAALAVCGALAGAPLFGQTPSAPPAPPITPAEAAPRAPQKPVEPVVFDFESSLAGWTAGADKAAVALVDGADWNRKGHVVDLKSKDGASATVRLQQRLDLSGYRELRFDVLLPEGQGQKMQAVAYFVDSDDLWYQSWRPITPKPGSWETVEVDLRPEAAALEPVGHARPWGPYAARSVKEIGLRFFADRTLYGNIRLDNIILKPRPEGLGRQEIFNYETSGDEVGQFKKFEITFELSRSYANPFDPAQIEILGLFTSPGGKLITVPGFFYQDYERRTDRKIERLSPVGSPKWKVRFAPHETGKWSFQVQISDGDSGRQGTAAGLTTPAREFRCVPADDPGFIRVSDADPRCFEFEDGSFFYPIGHNIPATYNTKAADKLGVTLEPYEGTGAYDRYLDGMSRASENYGLIWLASWSFGLEWCRTPVKSGSLRPDAPRWAYEDLGRYNQENAWRLDYVLERAENKGIYIQLALTTFGHFRSSEEFEGDWKNSPYNVRHGGPLTHPQEFWTDEPSQEMYQRMVRYVMARWGYDSHIAAWQLCNELDLVSGFHNRRDAGVPKSCFIAWAQRCAATIRKFDPNGHLVTVNFSQGGVDTAIIKLPEISFSSSNHYCHDIVETMRNSIYPAMSALGKPAIMTECGDDYKGSSPAMIERYMHIGLWSSYMIPFAGAGMAWWWDFIDDRDLYGMFRPLAEFAKGEDRRNRALQMSEGQLTETGGAHVLELTAITLQDTRSGYFWIYERSMERPEAAAAYSPRRREGLSLELKGFAAGSYHVEFWDTWRGGRVQEATVQSKDGTLTCSVPAFVSDIAGKIKPVKPDAVSAR